DGQRLGFRRPPHRPAIDGHRAALRSDDDSAPRGQAHAHDGGVTHARAVGIPSTATLPMCLLRAISSNASLTRPTGNALVGSGGSSRAVILRIRSAHTSPNRGRSSLTITAENDKPFSNGPMRNGVSA